MNKARCTQCNTTIESKTRHDYVPCLCGAIFVDGGDAYWHYGGTGMQFFVRIFEDGHEEMHEEEE